MQYVIVRTVTYCKSELGTEFMSEREGNSGKFVGNACTVLLNKHGIAKQLGLCSMARRPTELDKKGRRLKNQNKEVCKCFAPFVKLHYYDCPAVKNSCPIHGNNRHHGLKDEKADPEKNMIISFHPSSKTERLFQPVKTLLAHCNPDTKVNLRYYSPESTTSKESFKDQQVQTTSDGGKTALNNNVFVEKTKSFVADKTNKMKKLKQCFHSPCNSIVHKSRSQTSIRETFHGIFRDDRKKMNELDSKARDNPPDDSLTCDDSLQRLSNKFDFKNWDKVSAEKTDSDFITVTHQAKNNLINHKIFEIKHKKGLNDYPFVGLPDHSAHLVYSSLDVERRLQKTKGDPGGKVRDQIFLRTPPPSEGSRENDSKRKKDEELSSLENSSSSSSVYFTPFIFVPARANSKPTVTGWSDEAVQVGSKEHGDGKREPQTPSPKSEQELISCAEESKRASVLLQTDPERQSGDSANLEWYLRPLEVAESFTTRGTQTDESLFRLDKCVGDSRHLSQLSSEIFALASQPGDSYTQGTQTSVTPTDSGVLGSSEPSETRTAEVQTESRSRPGNIQSTTTWTMTTLDKLVQTESCKVLEVQRLWSFKVKKSQMGVPKLCNKTTQATLDQSMSSEEVSEFIDLDSSNVTFVVKPFNSQESDRAIDKLSKAWWGKSHSDSELIASSKCGCLKPEYVIPLPQACSCKQSESTKMKCSQKNTSSLLPDAEVDSSKNAKVFRLESKADKSLGTDDGSQRSYKRANKALGTDSGVDLPPEMSGRADKALGTDSGVVRMSRRVDKALGTDNDGFLAPATAKKTAKSPRDVEYSTKAEQTSLKDEGPSTTLSDLSELTKMIQEFFEKTAKPSWKTCPCDSSMATNRTVTTETTRRSKKEYVDHAVGAHTENDKKVDSEVMTDTPRKTKLGFTNAETQASSSAKEGPSNTPPTDRIKIRRSVLLDDNETKTRFICSVCAREISTFSINAATNTENLHASPEKKDKITTSVSTEVSELLKVKTVRTFQSFDNPKKMTSAPEPSPRVRLVDANREETTQSKHTPPRESPRTLTKNSAPTPRPAPGHTTTDRTAHPPALDSLRRTPTTTIQKPFTLKGCICEASTDLCTKDTCPDREASPTTPTTSRPAPQRTDHPALPRADHSEMPNSQSRSGRRSTDRSRTQRRTLEPFYPVLIESSWPKDFTWRVPEKMHTQSILEDSQSPTSQKRSCERETEPADLPAEKKIKSELEKSSGQYFMFGNAGSQDLRMGDRILFPSKAGFILIPSLSTSSVAPPKKHGLSQSKMIKSEERVREPSQQRGVLPPEGLNEPPDLSSTKSCRLTPIRLECDDKLFECRVCKSLTFLKTDKDGVVFHWGHGLFTCRPTMLQCPNPTACHPRKDDLESLHRNESSTQNLDDLLEELSHFSDRSGSPSPYEALPEEADETSEEEQDSGP